MDDECLLLAGLLLVLLAGDMFSGCCEGLFVLQ